VPRSVTGDKRSFHIFIMSFRQTKRCSICMQSWVTHLKNNSIVTHSVYTLMLRLIHPANKRSPPILNDLSEDARMRIESKAIYITQEYQASSAPRGSPALPPIINRGCASFVGIRFRNFGQGSSAQIPMNYNSTFHPKFLARPTEVHCSSDDYNR